MDQATGTADFRGDLGVDVFLNGIIPASTLATGVYFYGEDEFNGQGAAGLIADGSPPTFTWTARFPDAEMWNGAAEGDFARIYLAGRDALGDSAGNFVVATTGAVDAGVGTSVDIGGDAGADEFQDVVERPTFGYFDVFTLVGQNSDGDTLVLQTSFPPPCNNGVFEPGFEECEAGIDETACPGYCSAFDCTCSKEASFTLFDLAIGHNMLFSKVQDLLHIVKDFLVQLEFKTIEFTLANYACDDQPVSFWFPSDQDPYGKLHEIDSMIQLLIDSLQRGLDAGGDFGTIDGADLSDAQGRLDEAENQINLGNFRRALECKCLAYKGLAEITDSSAPPLNDCLIP